MRHLILSVLFFVVVPPLVQAAEQATALQPLRQGAALYTSKDYTGTTQTFMSDVADLSRTQVGDNRTTSVRVAPGCRVRLFDGPKFSGQSLDLDGDTPTLRGKTVNVNQASSLQVRCGRMPFPDETAARTAETQDRAAAQRGSNSGAATTDTTRSSESSATAAPPAAPATGVTLYTEHGYKGTSRNVRNAVPDLSATEVGSNRARSIQIASGCHVDLYAGKAFSGETTRLYRSAVNLGSFDKRVSSLNVVCGQSGAASAPGATPGSGSGAGAAAAAGAAAGAAVAGSGSAAQPPKSGVRVFESRDFQGKSQTITQDMPDLSRSRIGDGVARSILVAEGCTAELYDQPNYRGNRTFVDASMQTLVNTPVGNRALSSMRVQCAVPACPGSSGMERCVTLYADSDWGGQSESFDADVADLRRTDIGDRRARSLRVSDGCTGVLYSQPDFSGDAQEYRRDESRLERTGFGADRASSLRFYCGDAPAAGAAAGGGVTLFEHRDFGGRSETFTRDVVDLEGTIIGPDEASSVRVDPGCRAWLYDETEFYGNYSVIDQDEPTLGSLTVGGDRTRSLRVDCSGSAGTGYNDSSGTAGGEVTLYQHAGFLGRSETFRGDVRDLRGTEIGERETSSIRVSSGCTATLFSDPDFGGRSSNFSGDTSTFFFSEIGDDRAASLQLRCN